MPRNSFKKSERRSYERWLDAKYESCHCEELAMDDDPVGALCPHCEMEGENRYWQIEAATERLEAARSRYRSALMSDPNAPGYDRLCSNFQDEVEAAEQELEELGAPVEHEKRVAVVAAEAAAPKPAPKPSPWQLQVDAIRPLLAGVQAARSTEQKLPLVRGLFTLLLTERAFLAAQPNFRNAVVKKIAEFRADPKAEPLTECLDAVDKMLEELPAREDYKA
jgi:hypothetical protein